MGILHIILEAEKTMDESHEMREDLRAGCERVTDSDIAAICQVMTDVEEAEGFDELFTQGALAAFSFLSVPEGEEMHATTLEEFMANAWAKTRDMRAIEQLIDILMGGTE